MKNQIFGCDLCQTACPWNQFAKPAQEPDFLPRHNFAKIKISELLAWDEARFLKESEGTPLRRINFATWRRNLINVANL